MEPLDRQRMRAGFDRFYARKWTGHDGFWLDWYPAHLGLYADLLRARNAAISAALPRGLGRVLDCGCGAGDVSALLRDHAATVVSIDIAQANLVQTRRNLAASGGSHVLRASAEDLPFASGQFDAVVLADVIEHIPGRAQALAELHRVLAPGGLLIVATPDGDVLEKIEQVDRVAMRAVRTARAAVRFAQRRPPIAAPVVDDDAWEAFFTRPELAAAVEAAGFRIRAHENVCFYPGPEGGGTFAVLLAALRPFERFRARLFEPALRGLFGAIARARVLNQKQLVVAVK
jgi:SAM-dependent methyltransferase